MKFYRHWRRSSPFRDAIRRIVITLGIVGVIMLVAYLSVGR